MHYAAVISALALLFVTGEMTRSRPGDVVIGDATSHAALAARDTGAFHAIAAFRAFATNSARISLAQAEAAGRVLVVPNGTPARVLEGTREGGPIRVELVDGPLRGAVVYVADAQALR